MASCGPASLTKCSRLCPEQCVHLLGPVLHSHRASAVEEGVTFGRAETRASFHIHENSLLMAFYAHLCGCSH